MLRKIAVLAVYALAVLAFPADAAKPDPSPTVTIMTQNMDDGTDMTFIIAALMGELPLGTAVDMTFAEISLSVLPQRTALVAREIARLKPELVALQEAALWRTGPKPESATGVLIDSLDLLLAALKDEDVPYNVVAVNELLDLAFMGDTLLPGALRFTDRNAILIRADLKPPQFHLSNVHARTFATALPFPVSETVTLTIPAGWIHADVHVGNKQFRIVTTHLQSPIGELPGPIQVQVGQAQELLNALRNVTVPVVICGDFNSDALRGYGPDATPTVDLIEAGGYTEVWAATHLRGDLGATWPYFLEDQIPNLTDIPPLFFAPFAPFERIDLFFAKGLNAASSELVVASLPGPPYVPPYASDHAGVIAAFKP